MEQKVKYGEHALHMPHRRLMDPQTALAQPVCRADAVRQGLEGESA